MAGGCRSEGSAQSTYDQVRLQIKRGQIDLAGAEVDRFYGRYPSPDSIWHWRFLVLKAEILARRGSRKEALELLKAEPPAAFLNTDVAVRRKLVQGVASAWEQPKDAEPFLADAEGLATTYQPQLLGEVALGSGLVNFLTGDLPAAAAGYRNALLDGQKQNDQYLQTSALGGLAVVATKQQHYDEAIDWGGAALRLAQSLNVQSSLAQILGNLAWNYRKLGDFDTALSLYDQAVQAAARAGVVELQLYWMSGTASVYYEQRNFQGAETVLSRGLGLARGEGNARTLIDYLNGLAETQLETGQADAAEKLNEEAIRLEANNLDRAQFLTSQLVQGRILVLRHELPEAEKFFRATAQDPKADMSQKWEAEARLAQVFADSGLAPAAESEFQHSVDTIEAARSSIQGENLRLSFLSSAISFYDDYIEFLASRGRMSEALRVAELSRAKTLAEGLGDAGKTGLASTASSEPQKLAGRLKSTLLFYWLGEKQSHLWVITSAAVTHLALRPADQIEPVLKSYREALFQSRDPLETGNADAQKLYSMLVQSAEKFIPKDSRVIVLPDGSLYGLNFESLIVPGPRPHYWIEDVTLTTANSLTLLASATARVAPRDKTLFLVGNTVSPSSDFPALPQAADEMQDVEKYFPQAHRAVLTGAAGTPTAYLSSQPERFSYMHFVTHGTASRTRPLESAVILSKEKDADSFKLYARDIVKHHLSAYLVVISACNGAGTRAYSGEGLVGLSWAFLRAGAHNVIGALWEVSDSSTPQLMDKLYDGLSHGQDPATALRAAKLSLLHSGTVYKKPFYWAPFQLYAGS